MTTGFTRQYVILRPRQGSAGGFIRLETKQGRLCVAVRCNQMPASALRVLLLSGDPHTGAVLDLGLMHDTGKRQASLYREDLPGSYAGCHTAVICTDWPDPQLILYGWLTPHPACTLWQLQEAVEKYLCVPVQDSLHTPRIARALTEHLPLCMVLRQ